MGSYNKPYHYITGTAGVDLLAGKGKGVTMSAEGVFGLPAAGAKIVGVLEHPLKLNELGSAMCEGEVAILAGGPINPGEELEVAADGRFIKLASGKSVGICLVAASAGKYSTMLIK